MQERIPLSKLTEHVQEPEVQRRLERLRSTDLNYHNPDTDPDEEPALAPHCNSILDMPLRRTEFTPPEEECELMRSLMRESESIPPDRMRAGPQYPYFLRYMKALQTELDKIRPGFTPEHLAPYDYQSDRVRRDISSTDNETQILLNALSEWRLDCLDAISDKTIYPATADQYLVPDTLDTPPFLRATDDWAYYKAGQACASACLRMIFHAISDYPLSQTALGNALIAKYKTPIVHDDVLVRLLKTPTFQDLSSRSVITAEYIGMDFGRLQKIADAIKQQHADAQVFCLVNLSSRAAGRRTWHTSILLAADKEKVVYHDPSNVHGGAYETEARASFAKRWTQTYNRARLVIATPTADREL